MLNRRNKPLKPLIDILKQNGAYVGYSAGENRVSLITENGEIVIDRNFNIFNSLYKRPNSVYSTTTEYNYMNSEYNCIYESKYSDKLSECFRNLSNISTQKNNSSYSVSYKTTHQIRIENSYNSNLGLLKAS